MQLSALSEVLLVVGLILLIISAIFYRFPPKNINMLYGYRTPRSMKSEEAWEFSQKLSARQLLRLSAFMILAGVAFLFIDVSHWSAWLTISVIFGFIIIGFGALFYTVEKALRNKFN